jgi:uncharacterized protein YcnI
MKKTSDDVCTKFVIENETAEGIGTNLEDTQQVSNQLNESVIENQESDGSQVKLSEMKKTSDDVCTKFVIENEMAEGIGTNLEDTQQVSNQLNESVIEIQVSDDEILLNSNELQNLFDQFFDTSVLDNQGSEDNSSAKSNKVEEMSVQVCNKSSFETQESDDDHLALDHSAFKRKRFRILSESDDSCGQGKFHTDREILAADTDSDNKIIGPVNNPTDQEIIVSDTDNDSCHSEVFPLLSRKVRPSKETGTDLDELDDSETSGFLVRDIQNRNIYVSCVEKSLFTTLGKRKKTDRKYNARHVCPFCKLKKSNFSHHILSKKHEGEEVIKELKRIKDGAERKRQINQLRLKSDHEHNLNVLKEKKGEIFMPPYRKIGGI